MAIYLPKTAIIPDSFSLQNAGYSPAGQADVKRF
jgi:hypothetical protein